MRQVVAWWDNGARRRQRDSYQEEAEKESFSGSDDEIDDDSAQATHRRPLRPPRPLVPRRLEDAQLREVKDYVVLNAMTFLNDTIET